MAEDDDKPADQPVAACRIVQGALGWLKRAPEGEEGYLVGHLACPGRRFPDVLGALAKRSNAHTWGGDKQVRREDGGIVGLGKESRKMWSGSVLGGLTKTLIPFL